MAKADMAPELLALLGPRFKAIPVLNIFRTLAHAPKAFKRFMAWGGYILSDANSLSARDRELGHAWRSTEAIPMCTCPWTDTDAH